MIAVFRCRPLRHRDFGECCAAATKPPHSRGAPLARPPGNRHLGSLREAITVRWKSAPRDGEAADRRRMAVVTLLKKVRASGTAAALSLLMFLPAVAAAQG